jgi:hypothetical protein
MPFKKAALQLAPQEMLQGAQEAQGRNATPRIYYIIAIVIILFTCDVVY